ncbi:signal peptide peptidase SppA [Alteraurantiacibacter palmitatis]|uniref:Signal peptide peptidase SppA n=1 Tax=Alteraurantiacibacter palmitatis TaxID=2054628 RepID=A0ABV7E729_9SPHN
MSFAGKVWRLLVGIKDALALLFLLLFFGVLFAALSARPSPAQVREGALLLKLDGQIVEEPAVIDPVQTLLSGTLPMQEYAARDLTRAIDAAIADDRIKAIALDLSTFTGGPAVSVREVAEALARFRASEKPVIAYGVAMADDAVLLAAQASEVWLDPMGGVAVRGPGGSILFYADALQRFGITAHVYQVGTYKGTGEPFTNSAMSPALRENLETYTAQMWEEFLSHVRRARPDANLDAVSTGLVAAAEQAGGDLARVALEAKLVDRLGTREEWAMRLVEVAGKDRLDKRPGAFAATDLDVWMAASAQGEGGGLRSLTGGSKKAIGIITIAGEISDGNAGPGSAGAARITALLEDALDDDLAALVVRIDSPGGTVTGSETIRRALMRYRQQDIPVVISMGNMAASGGYWIATAGQRIFAEPETLTGSIGVVLMVPSFETILGRYGVNAESVRTTPLSGQPDILGGFTPETDALLQSETQAIYGRFVSLVAEARGVSAARADELAQGRIWTGGSARQMGLVDQFGGLDAAIAWAAEQAGLAEGEWEERFLATPPDPFKAMLAGILTGQSAHARAEAPVLSSVSALIAGQEQTTMARVVADMNRLMSSTGAQALCLPCTGDAPALRANLHGGQALWQRALRSILAE